MGYNLMSLVKTFGLTLQEGAEAARSSVPTTSSKPTADVDYSSLIIQSVGLIVSIIVAIAFCRSVKDKIREKEEFSGAGWGIANGVLGIGILWVIIAHNSINKEIEKIKDKKYKKYVELQMKDFVKAYGTCLIIWVVILIIMFAFNR